MERHGFACAGSMRLIVWPDANENEHRICSLAHCAINPTTACQPHVFLATKKLYDYRLQIRPINASGFLRFPPQQPLRDTMLARAEKIEDAMQEELHCPITREPMRVPMMAADGFTYEKTAIQRWLTGRGPSATSPMTGEALANHRLVLNRLAIRMIRATSEAAQASLRPAAAM